MFGSLVLTEEQRDLQDSVRRFLAEQAPLSSARASADNGASDQGLWKRLTTELGLTALSVAEQDGGIGAGWPEVVLVFEEAGYALLAAPLLAALLATTVLTACGDGADLLASIAVDGRVATLALTADGGLWDPAHVEVEAQAGVLSGRASYVLEGATAEILIVVARERGGLSLYAVDTTSDGLTRTQLSVLDRTRPLALVEFERTPARLLGLAGKAGEVVQRAVALGIVALGAEQVGLAQRALDEAVAYAKDRHQFGRAIGGFQAVKHLLAEVLVGVESARSAVRYAAASIAEDAPDTVVRSSMVKAWCSEVAYRAAADSIQVHGGIGYTWEHDAHLLFKRAVSSARLFGDAAAHRALVADLMGV